MQDAAKEIDRPIKSKGEMKDAVSPRENSMARFNAFPTTDKPFLSTGCDHKGVPGCTGEPST